MPDEAQTEWSDLVEKHGAYSIHKGMDVPFVVVHSEHGEVGGAPDLQEARNLIAEIHKC